MYTPLALIILIARFVLSPVRWAAREMIICSAPRRQEPKLRKLSYWARDTFWRTLPCCPFSEPCKGPYSAKFAGKNDELADLTRTRNACRAAGADEWRIILLEGRYAMPWINTKTLAAAA